MSLCPSILTSQSVAYTLSVPYLIYVLKSQPCLGGGEMNMVTLLSEHVVENEKILRSNMEKVVEFEKFLRKKREVVEIFFWTFDMCDS